MTDILKLIPKVIYDGIPLSNLMVSARIINSVLEKHKVFHQYNVKELERPDTVAADYYGSPDYTWLVLYSNRIYDPYFQWPLTYKELLEFMKAKYGRIEELMNEIKHYEYTGITGESKADIDRISWTMSAATFNKLDPTEKIGWTPKMVYDWEIEQNESKRTIQLLSNQYLPLIERELVGLFNG